MYRFPSKTSVDARVKPAIARRITAELDPIDKKIVELKDEGIDESRIREKILKEFGVDYSRKTISSRYIRIRLKLGKANAESLKNGDLNWSTALVSLPLTRESFNTYSCRTRLALKHCNMGMNEWRKSTVGCRN